MSNELFLAHFRSAQQLWPDQGELHICQDPQTGLYALVSIYDTTLGPALGGCRFIEYESIVHAIHDVTRLAKGMCYKAAATGLEMGGGKAVILKPRDLPCSREAFFQRFGEFVETLNGRYITAMDSGVTIEDMDAIASVTPYVASKSSDGNPSPFTALGVFEGIKAAVKHRFDRDDLAGLHVAIRGAGNVGFNLCRHLHKAGAKITVADIDPERVANCVKHFSTQTCHIDDVYQLDCDIYSPCALGAGLNDHTIPKIKAKIIAGAANNQLAEAHHGQQLHNLGILYAPDYVINAGGLVHCVSSYRDWNTDMEEHKIHQIYDSLLAIFSASEAHNTPTSEEADRLAERRLNTAKGETA